MTRAPHSTFRRSLAGLLALVLAVGPVAPSYAALTPLADQPLNITTSAKPNIVLTVDDSTSMLFDFLPDFVVTRPFCRDGTGAAAALCGSSGAANDLTLVGGGKYFSPGYIFEQFNAPYQAFDASYGKSGPGAGCFPGTPPTCSEGIDPGPLPGISRYPAGVQPTWPNSFKPYEYWLYWPAPVHNAAINALYYDPLLTYDPPVDAAGVSYQQMNAANTINWTKVPVDPWAAAIVYADLTASVNLGQWCNSDWSIGLEKNTSVCRVNGSNAAAFSTVPASDGADYTYPWAPPSFTVSASPGPTTSITYAAQKVTLDGTLTGTGIKAAWANAKNEKYFYENENVIWCDPTSPSWPQTGPLVSQVCQNYKAQTCSAFAGACVNKTSGVCNNVPTCNGANPGTCSGYKPPLCNGTAGVCNNYIPASCSAGKCTGSSAQTCNGTLQTCNTQAQTCSGPFSQICNLPGTQTCQPPVCNITYNPPGCNLLPPDPENPCTPITTCAPPICTPDPGKCSLSGASCTADAQCPQLPGACSLTGGACMSNADCANSGTCSIDQKLCTSSGNCAILGGTCSKTGQACASNANCPASGNCQVGNAVCLKDSDCPGTCAKPAGQQCYSAATCQDTKGLCSDGSTACTTAADCPLTGGTCSITTCQNGAVCNNNNQCKNIGDQQCKNRSCTLSGQCPSVNGSCNGGPTPGAACQTDAQCTKNGACVGGSTPGAVCTTVANCGGGLCSDGTTANCFKNGDCPNAGKCNSNGQACNNDNQCPPSNGVCSLTNQPCTTPGTDLVNCPAQGTCSITGGLCSSNAACPQQPGPLPPSAAVCSTGGVGGNALATLRNDAENNGVVCRRNNKSSGAYTSGPFDYPSGKFLTPITNGTGADACPATNHWTTVPRHYWKVSVEWCDKQIATAGDKWLNFGTSTGGSCQAFNDATHIYPRYYQFGAAAGTDNYATPAFTRVDLDISKRATAIYDHGLDADGNPIKRNFDDEMTNYANWFAYYRTRIQAVKTVTSLTFKELDNTFRVGFHTLSNGALTLAAQNDPAQFVNIADFTAAQKAKWFAQLFAVRIPLEQETPNLDAMTRIGEYFKNGASGDLAGSTDPIVLSCQKNWHMLFTDGFTNQKKVPAVGVGDQDDTVPNYPDVGTKPIAGLTPGQPWPWFYREDPTGQASEAASDYAMYYWVTDLRPAGPFATNNVPTSLVDPAAWQHLNFAAMSLGTQGKLPLGNQSVTETLLASGADKWPQPYPTVNKPDNSGVDDLWHAAINGRGRFVNAESADELKLGMGQILQDITNQAGARSGAGFQSSVISGANKWIYRARFEPGWAGSLAKIEVDPLTGVQGSTVWEASTQLSMQLVPTALDPQPWLTQRRIVTLNDVGTAVPFVWANLSATQQASLAPGKPKKAQKVWAFLRGDATNEGTKLGQLRVRAKGVSGENFLGDIVNSRAVYVGPPKSAYLDTNDANYSTFKATFAGRKPMVYVGTNEGMLHAFDDTNGNELWSYIPHPLYRPDSTGLGGLAYQDGALPPFRHHYYVDSTPRIVDVDFNVGTGNWHSLLVGGMGKGGTSYYAIDVTNPDGIKTEADVANGVLWEFTNADLGYTYGQPMVAKTRAFGGKWLVIVPSGYNNASGVGKVFFVDATSGALLYTLSTGSGTAGNPAGLAQIAGYTKDYHNQLVEQIYGGDLYGNFWRFDVSDANPANWKVDQLAYLTAPDGTPQPVTTAPQIEIDLANGVDRWVFVGTGRLLHDSDLADGQAQTMYAIRDGTANAPKPFTATIARTDLDPLVDKLNGLASKPAIGWYDDLPAGQRIVTPIQAAVSAVAYIGTSAQTDPCLTGQPATVYVREFEQGSSLLLDSLGNQVSSITSAEGGVGIEIVVFSDTATGSDNPDLRIAITLGTTGDVRFFKIKLPNILSAHRMSWRLIGQ